MPIINSSLGFLGFGASKEDAVAAAGAAIEMWQLAKSKLDSVSIYPYLESGYPAFIDARLSKANELLKKAEKAPTGLTFFGALVEEARSSLSIAKAVVEQFKQLGDMVMAKRAPLRGSVKTPAIGGEDVSVLGPGAAIALAVVAGAVIIFATYKGAKAVRTRFRR